MKQTNNNEVDLLLRSLARQREKSELEGEIFSEHLDADELNSYAEGVVPAPARSRYVEHLAECEACRSIVVNLSQAAGAATRYEVPQPQGGSSFWQKMVGLFSPAVLRFAVPALVLTIVIGIGFVALRQQRGNDLVAMRSTEEPRAAVESQHESQTANPSKSEIPAAVSGSPESYDNRTKRDTSKLQEKKSVIGQESSPIDSVVAKAATEKDTATGEGAGVGTTEPYAPPKAAAPASPPVTFGVQKSADLAKEAPAKREDQERSRDEFRNQPNEEHGPSRSRNNSATVASQRNAGVVGGRGLSGLDKNKISVAETRSISGRRFAREDSVWVDTDYNPQRATIRVTRGSDQFRALVADEPGIRAIADQLSGAVIVIWKNRAYRIQ